jgi:hypothetical protein
LILTALSAAWQSEADEERLLATAEIVAAASGAPASDIPREIVGWLARGPMKIDVQIMELALKQVEAVRDKSALRGLWAEAGELEAWLSVVEDLSKRFRGVHLSAQ